MESIFRMERLSNKFLLMFIALIAGGVLGYEISQHFSTPVLQVRRANDPQYSYINPLLSCSVSENKEFSEYKPFESKVNAVISSADTSKVSTVSVYYRDLNTGRWFGINENETYSPASLMKVPLMIAYFKDAESDPSVLKESIYYTGSNALSSNNEYYKSKVQIAPGKSYTAQDLVEAMIEHSDNAAADLLYNNMDQNSFDEVLTDIGIRLPNLPQNSGTDDFVTVKAYSYLFRLLYNSTYLGRTFSEKALEILTRTDFSQGLRQGVPEPVPIAHKFGERTILHSDLSLDHRELHDCGIVFYPEHPYLLCVMTRGSDFDALSTTIQSISKTVYDTVKAN